MSTLEVGKRLVELCQAGKGDDAVIELYADDVVSVEAGGPPGMDRTSNGKEAVIAKGKWWGDNHTVHSAKADGPWPHDDKFIVRFTYDITQKATGARFTMDEAGLYWVKDGKVVREEFFYSA